MDDPERVFYFCLGYILGKRNLGRAMPLSDIIWMKICLKPSIGIKIGI